MLRRTLPFPSRCRSARATLATGLLLAALHGAPVAAAPMEYRIDPEHLAIGFLVDHIGYASVLGQFLEAQGSFVFDEDTRTLSDLEVTIEADSVFTNHADRDGHLRADDFLAAGDHPTITFVGRSSEATGPRTGRVTGDLTLRGVTNPVTLDVTWNKSGPYPFGDNYVLGVSARTVLTRSAFGMTYAVENGWVGDDVEILIELEAIRQ